MCAEKDPLTCHRTILVCRALKNPSISIFHISGDGALESHTAAEKRLMQTLGIKPDMFQDEETCIEDAYKQQAARIAYVRKPQSTAVGQ